MKYIRSINEVNGCYLIQDSFLTLYKEVVRCFDLSQNLLWNRLVPGNSTNCIIYREHAHIEFIDKESGFEKTISLALKTGHVVESDMENYMVRSVSNQGYVIALKYNADYSTNTFCIQLPFSVKWEKRMEDLPLFIDGKYLVSGVKNTISLVGDNGEIVWRFDTSELGNWFDYDGKEKVTEVSRILGTINGSLYCYLNNGKILVLDIKSGEKNTILKNDKHPKFDTFGDSIELDFKRGKLIQLARQDLIEVDLQTREVSMTRIEDMNSSNIENASRIAYDNTHIYFTDKNAQTLGALNRISHKLDWTYKLSQDGVEGSEHPRYGRELKLKGDRLYILDNKSTLHIFEKESHPA